ESSAPLAHPSSPTRRSSDLWTVSTTSVWPKSSRRPRPSCSTCGSSRPPASWRTTVDSRLCVATSLVSTPCSTNGSWTCGRTPLMLRKRASDGGDYEHRVHCCRAQHTQVRTRLRCVRQDGQDHRRRGRGAHEAPPLRQGHAQVGQVQGSR